MSFSLKPFYTSLWLMEVPIRDKNGCGKHFEKFIAGGEGRVFLWSGRRGLWTEAAAEKDSV